MKVYLINPKFSSTMWSFEGLRPFTGTRFLTTPLGLATIAALTPAHWDVEIADENVEKINFENDADLIGITAFNVQFQRAVQIAAEFRKRGKAVVFGGPYCSLFPEAFEGKGDYLISGEAEEIWPEFLADFEKGMAKRHYVAQNEKIHLETSPIPRYELLRLDRYNIACLQTTRGCPFQCEFCDIIVMDGRLPRSKPVEHVLAEVQHCVEQGAHYILFGDANFIGNIPYARKLLAALGEYSRKNNYPIEFCCQLTINVAHYPELLQLLKDANFYSVFVGIESPRTESLMETKKLQNTRHSIKEDIARIQSYDISVMAGMIVGFDSDDKLIFKEQVDFLKELGVPFTSCGTLVALPNTPLLKRLKTEGRLIDMEWSEINGHGAADCNFLPKKMTLEELKQGHNWLIRCLYRYDTFAERLTTLLARFQNKGKEHKRASIGFKFGYMLIKVLFYYLLTWDKDRREFFLKTFSSAAKGPSSMAKWLEYFRWIATYRSFREYVIKCHGFPESVHPDRPIFTQVSSPVLSEVPTGG